MQATDLDGLVDCWVCGGSGDDPVAKNPICRFCGGSGEANHYGPKHSGGQGQDADGDHVIMHAWVDPNNDALYVHRLTVDHPRMPAFNQRFGPSTNADLDPESPKADYEADTLDQLQNNPLGNLGPYDIRGHRVAAENLPSNQWPTDGDLSIDQAEAWQRARGAVGMADELAAIKSRLNL